MGAPVRNTKGHPAMIRAPRAAVSCAILVTALAGCGPTSGDDAGAPDAAMPDDAGEHDAGDVDAGTPDAGRPDAGTPDAGRTIDAGTRDSGTPDAGRFDAGTRDAGPASPCQPPCTGGLICDGRYCVVPSDCTVSSYSACALPGGGTGLCCSGLCSDVANDSLNCSYCGEICAPGTYC